MKPFLLSILASGALCTIASAQLSIGVNFYTSFAGDPSTAIDGPSVELAGINSTAVTGANTNRQDNWNDIPGGASNGSGTQNSLVASNGTTTGVNLTWGGTDIGGSTNWPGATNDGILLSGFLFGANSTASATFSGLSNTFSNFYDVIVYVSADGIIEAPNIALRQGGNLVASGTVDDNVAGGAAFNFPNDYNDASLDGGGNFIVFHGLSGDNLVVESSQAMGNGIISGVQIVSNTVPEPSVYSAAFGLLALAAVGLRRRFVSRR
jgi:MYXO-CTERM domain-containing protein